MSPLDRVRAWRDRLRAATPPRGPLSPEGAARVWGDALDALTDEALAAAAAIPGEPFATAAMAAPRTVPTAPLEWLAVLLARGTAVTLKVPSDAREAGVFLGAHGDDLPLRITTDRDALRDAELAIAMGSDETAAAVRALRGDRPTLAFGDRFSAAWVTRPEGFAAVAADAAAFDGRGCLSPVSVFTPFSEDTALDALAAGMALAERRWPRGEISAAEGAWLRVRAARAARWVPGDRWSLATGLDPTGGLPRSLVVVSVPTLDAALARLGGRALSTLGTDDPSATAPPGARLAPLGGMQRPPLDRRHDGVDWLRATLRASPGRAG